MIVTREYRDEDFAYTFFVAEATKMRKKSTGSTRKNSLSNLRDRMINEIIKKKT